jgi:hypothetical protein
MRNGSSCSTSKQLDFLFDYTKFHIGVYTTLGSLMIAILGLEPWKSASGQALLASHLFNLKLSIGLLLVAGAAGGVIASNIPHAKTFEQFVAKPLCVWGFKLGCYGSWAWIEHYAFWLAVTFTATSFILHPSTWCYVVAVGVVGLAVRLFSAWRNRRSLSLDHTAVAPTVK